MLLGAWDNQVSKSMKVSASLPSLLAEALEIGASLSEEAYCGRFAPTPSGPLHLGNIRTALISWLKARRSSGKWILRIDDLDTPRNYPGAVEKIQQDLLWLGLTWDGPIIFQSQRKALYSSALSFLKSQDKLFACFCSRKLLTKQTTSIYSGKCRNLELGFDKKNGKCPSLRLKVSKNFSKSSGDIVLKRADGVIAYHLATVVDELTLGVNQVIRGNDLSASRSSQLAVLDALNQRSISYAHIPLMLNTDGTKLSKRNGGFGLDYLRSKGMNASKTIGFLASSLDLVPKDSELSSLDLLSELKNRNLDHLLKKGFLDKE